MLGLSELKQTRVYQEAKQEGIEEGKQLGIEQGKLQGKLEAIPRLLRMGLSLEQIVEALDLPILEAIPRMLRMGLSLEQIAEALNLPLEVVQQIAQLTEN